MAELSVKIGSVFHWKEYEFEDGGRADKYFVIVGAKQGHNYLTVIATSQKKQKSYDAGCHHKEGYFHIPGGGKDWFPKDTWLLLSPPRELHPAEFLKRAHAREINLSG